MTRVRKLGIALLLVAGLVFAGCEQGVIGGPNDAATQTVVATQSPAGTGVGRPVQTPAPAAICKKQESACSIRSDAGGDCIPHL